MTRLQRARQLNEPEIGQITAFFKTLTGDQPSFVIAVLPPWRNATPRPVPFE
ncbi:MAG: hypothetical protein ACOH2I_06515 [Pseudomonas sp.]